VLNYNFLEGIIWKNFY